MQRLFAVLVPVILMMFACSGVRQFTITGKVSGSWNCLNAGSSPVPSTLTLQPLDRTIIFTRSNPQFSIKDVPDGDYTLVAACDSLWGKYPPVPVTVAGADVHLELVLPFPNHPARPPVITLTGHSDEVSSLAFSHNRSVLTTFAQDGTLIRWNLYTKEIIHSFQIDPYIVDMPVRLSPKGDLLAVLGKDGKVELWNTDQGEKILTMDSAYDRRSNLAFSSDSRLLSVWGSRGSSRVDFWDVSSGRLVHSVDMGQVEEASLRKPKPVIFSPDGKLLISIAESDRNWTIQWWDIENSLLSHTRPIPLDNWRGIVAIREIAISADDSLYALGAIGIENTGGLVIWNKSHDQAIITRFPVAMSQVTISPDGSRIATTTNDNSVVVWGSETGEPLYILVSDRLRINQVAWSPDGDLLAAGAGVGNVHLWETP